MVKMRSGNVSGSLGEDGPVGQQGKFLTLLVEGHLTKFSLMAVWVAQDNGHDPASMQSRFAPRRPGGPQGRQPANAEGGRLLPNLLLLRTPRLILDGPRDRLARPSPWSAQAISIFRENMLRASRLLLRHGPSLRPSDLCRFVMKTMLLVSISCVNRRAICGSPLLSFLPSLDRFAGSCIMNPFPPPPSGSRFLGVQAMMLTGTIPGQTVASEKGDCHAAGNAGSESGNDAGLRRGRQDRAGDGAAGRPLSDPPGSRPEARRLRRGAARLPQQGAAQGHAGGTRPRRRRSGLEAPDGRASGRASRRRPRPIASRSATSRNIASTSPTRTSRSAWCSTPRRCSRTSRRLT